MRKRNVVAGFALCVAAGNLAGAALAQQAGGASPPLQIFAAGSLGGAMGEAIQLYEKETGQLVQAQFGPAGLLRERIEKGERPDLFASANMTHPQALADRGLVTPPVVMAHNHLCARTLPDSGLTSGNLLDRMLDPQVGIGTSTPKSDPSGDYAWEMFARADAVHPGAQAILEQKAQKLMGGGASDPPVPAGQDRITWFLQQGRVQMMFVYCSSASATPDPQLATVQLPEALSVGADFGLSVVTASKADTSPAQRFAQFLLGPEGQRILARYGFTPARE